jgi:filamentous hemagglutinin family protein
MMIEIEYTKMKRIIVAFLLFLITTGQKHTLANEQQDSIWLNWKKETESSFWTAEVNRFDVPSWAVVEVKGPKDGLIRVTGDQPTSIKGTLISSNPIYVINPNGVVLGAKASIKNNQKILLSTDAMQ